MGVHDRGLRLDKGDQKRFQKNRTGTDVGMSFEGEYNQYKPMFFSREGNPDYSIVGNYRGATAFLICNGPSLLKVPESSMATLKRCWVMGINNGPRTFRPDAWVCVDPPSKFIKSIWVDPKILKFVPICHSEAPLWDNENWCPLGLNVGDMPNVLYYQRNAKFHAPRFLSELTFNWGCDEHNGGGRSVMLVAIRILYLLGFRHVYLLGCDLNMTEDKIYHFEEDKSKAGLNGNNNTYRRMINEYFPQLKPHFDKVGFNVYNCNPESALKVFPYVPIDDAISHALRLMPRDVNSERTCGMYDKIENKMKQWGVAMQTQKVNNG